MIYSRLHRRENKKTISLLAIVGGCMVILLAYIVVRDLRLKNGWEQVRGIERLEVVNISPHGFDVVWSTRSIPQEKQWVEWRGANQGREGQEEAEQIGTIYKASMHKLHSEENYTFRIRVGGSTYVLDNLTYNHVFLPKEIQELPISPAYGKALLPSGKPYAHGLLIYEVEGFFPIATFTKSTGEWLLPLTGLVNKKTMTITALSDGLPVTIRFFSYPQGSIRTTVGQTRPLQQAIIVGTTTIIASTEMQKGLVLGVINKESNTPARQIPSIIYPKEKALIPGNRPLIRGQAIPGRDGVAFIQGPRKQYSYRATADINGEWIVQYPLPLESGEYLFSFTTVDINNVPITLRRSFSIIKSGEQVLGEATGSPTLVPTLPTSTYISPSLSPTILPTVIQYPTIVPTRFIPTTTPPVTGGGMASFAYLALFCIIVGAGLVLAF